MPYLRYPHVHADEIVFVADDDLWIVAADGGDARRLTADHAPATHSFFSPDGSRIAYTADRDGHVEVYLLDRRDGASTRLTWWGRRTTRVRGWIDDEHVVVASDHGQPFAQRRRLHSVGLDGTRAPLPYGVAMSLAAHPDGAVAVTTPNSRDAAMWKRYRGGTASALWLDPAGDGQWRRLLADESAGIYSPCWVGDRLAFCSDLGARFPDRADEQAQVWSIDADGGDLRQHTRHVFASGSQSDAAGYVRDLTTDGQRLVYHARGRLYLMESLDAPARPVPVDLGPVRPPRRVLTFEDRVHRIEPDTACDASLLDWHGAAWWLTHRGGPARQVLGQDGVRIREPRFVAATREVVAVTDADGEDALEVVSLDGFEEPRRLAGGELGRVLHLAVSPDGERVCVIGHDGRIVLVALDSGEVTPVDRCATGEPVDPTFSPDGRYLVWSRPYLEFGAHRLVGVEISAGVPGRPFDLTSGRYDDASPVFTADGRHLVFLSARTFDPRYSAMGFDLAFSDAVRPWLVPLRATEPAPFGPVAQGWTLPRTSDPEVDDTDAEDDDEVMDDETPPEADRSSSPTLDLDGLEDRVMPFPVPSGEYANLRAVTDGVVWILRGHGAGELGAVRAGVDDESERDVLQRYDFRLRKVVDLGPADAAEVTGDGNRIVVREGDDVVVIPATGHVDDDSDKRVEIDTSRVEREIDVRAQWRQMFDENGRLMRDAYWRSDMNGIDWERVLAAYRPLVDQIATGDDLVDVLWECVGELNTSHCYVQPPLQDHPRRLGMLGADLRTDGTADEIEIVRILPGESSDPAARSPLRAAGVGAKPADRLVAVDGQRITSMRRLGELMAGTAERVVELTLRPADGSGLRRVAVVPIKDEETLRYQAWVASRRAYVQERSEGRLGYLHVPDMMSVGWAQLHRGIDDAMRHEGVVADVRYNRGGHTSQLVIERLLRRVIGWEFSRHVDEAETYPAQAARGPIVFLANQWSGSDGDIVNAAAQSYGLGPVIGERTWGGVVGIDGRFDLVDGTGVTQPRYPFYFAMHGWEVENHGVDPDIEVVVSPTDWETEATADVQLDRAISELLDRLEEHPAATPPPLPSPRVR